MLVETANPWSCDCKDHFCLKQLMPCSLQCIWPWFGPLIPHRITLADIQAKSSDFICNANSIHPCTGVFFYSSSALLFELYFTMVAQQISTRISLLILVSVTSSSVQEYGILHYKLILQLLLSVVWLASYHHFVVYALLVIRPVCSNNNCGS